VDEVNGWSWPTAEVSRTVALDPKHPLRSPKSGRCKLPKRTEHISKLRRCCALYAAVILDPFCARAMATNECQC
jgi:hypothetical protein